jgi:predicted dehydrogenase
MPRPDKVVDKRLKSKRKAIMKNLNRRDFIKTGAAAGFAMVSQQALGNTRRIAPGDKLNIAGIGVGGQGGSDLSNLESENIVALCDVDWDVAARTFAKYPKAKKYKDFRIMLEQQKDIDAVVIGTPDHTHAVAAMTAMRAGKHVYVEKPLTHSINEAQLLLKTARETGLATQMGNQGHAYNEMRLLKEWLADGAIGPVREVHVWTPHPVWPQDIDRPKETPPVPANMDWDLWIGPAPMRPYHPCYHPSLWRGWWDFGTGGLGDMGCHILDHVVYSLDLGYPTSVEARCSIFVPEMTWDKKMNTESYPRGSIVYYHFPAKGDRPTVRVVWYDGGLMPERPEELEPGRKMGDTYGGGLYFGDKGIIMTGSHGANGVRIIPESRMKAYTQPPETIPRSIGHHKEWIEACKGGAAAGSNFEYSVPLTIITLMGNVSLRTGEKLYWDAEKMQFSNSETANQFLNREYRTGWSI